MDPLNLVDLIHSNLTGDFSGRLASFLGEDRDKTQTGINAAIPSILLKLTNSASTPDGSRRLASAVNDTDTGILGSLGNFFERRFSTDAGTSTLRSILGAGGFSELTAGIGTSSGLSGRAVTTLLGVLAPVVFGVLKKVKDSRGLDAAGLSSLLSTQRNEIASAIPKEMPRMAGTPAEPTYAGELPRTDRYERRAATYTDTGTTRATSRRSLGWILPLLILAGLIGLIWHWSSKPGVHAGRDESGLAERTARLRDQYKSGTPGSLDRLKSKYQSVIQEAQAQGVQISNLSERDGKLVIEGTAPSAEAANKVWDEIKRADPNMQEIAASFSVNSSAEPTSTEQTAERETNTTGNTTEDIQMYTVKPGDTLAKISIAFYGNAEDYNRILDANKDQLSDPNMISVGQQLKIPTD